jgi:hypothetical protein
MRAALLVELACLRTTRAVPQMDIPIQPLLNVAEENLHSLVRDQRLRAHGAAELDRVRGEQDDGAAEEFRDTLVGDLRNRRTLATR